MLIFAAASNPANAQTRHGKEVSVTQTAPSNTSNNTSPNLTPFHLVFLSYQGYLKNQGIPSYGTFLSKYQQMDIHGRNLVKAGIEARLLPADTLNNQQYVNAVDSQLSAFNTEN